MLWNYQNKHRTYCKCLGIDGKEYIIRQDALVSGATQHIKGACTGGFKHDITNQRFGKLIAVRPLDKRGPNGGVVWECKCDCGNITTSTMSNLKRGHTTSCGCYKQEYIDSIKLDVIGNKYGKLTVLEEVFDPSYKRRMVKCLCDCGNYNICSITDLTTGHTLSCGCETKSKGEKYVEDLLRKFGIKYLQQHKFNGRKNIKPLHFDFYLPDLNICIEYDGEQHYKSVDYFGGEEGLKLRIQNDQIKNEYCKTHNIKLIRIPYYKTKKEIFEIISDLTSPATITA